MLISDWSSDVCSSDLHELDEAGRRVATEQRTLGTFQYLDAFDVVELLNPRPRKGHVAFIDIEAARGFIDEGRVGELADADVVTGGDRLFRSSAHAALKACGLGLASATVGGAKLRRART